MILPTSDGIGLVGVENGIVETGSGMAGHEPEVLKTRLFGGLAREKAGAKLVFLRGVEWRCEELGEGGGREGGKCGDR